MKIKYCDEPGHLPKLINSFIMVEIKMCATKSQNIPIYKTEIFLLWVIKLPGYIIRENIKHSIK